MSTNARSGLQLPTDDHMRSVVLSYLIHHGHTNTMKAFMTEVARREAAESKERCPLWESGLGSSDSDKTMGAIDYVVDGTLGRAMLEDRAADKRSSALDTRPSICENRVTITRGVGDSEGVLKAASARGAIRDAILSGRIDEAIERITDLLPSFLPISTTDTSAPTTLPDSQPNSYNLLHVELDSNPPTSSPLEAVVISKATLESPQTSEKPIQKAGMHPTESPPVGTPRLTDASETPVLDQTSRAKVESSLGRSINPVHILLNLRVQQFVEAVRTVPLHPDTCEQNNRLDIKEEESNGRRGPDSDVDMHTADSPIIIEPAELTSSPPTPITSKIDMDHAVGRQRRLFELATQLYQSVQSLTCSSDREIYATEVERVCSLMIGTIPEESLAAPYLSMTRREDLADQVNSSMMHHVGESPAPALQIWAQTTKVVWNQVALTHASSLRAADVPTGARMYSHYVSRSSGREEERNPPITVTPFDFPSLARI